MIHNLRDLDDETLAALTSVMLRRTDRDAVELLPLLTAETKRRYRMAVDRELLPVDLAIAS